MKVAEILQTDSGSRRHLGWLLPDPTLNIAAKRNYRRLASLLADNGTPARVLVVGGRIMGNGMEELLGAPGIRLIETDIALGPRTQIACDAHVLPFGDGTFDAVVMQAVLEHVRNPWQCVAEASRVVRAGALVYAETPFMQQVHADHDYTRFTFKGHRLLLRDFEEIDAGVAAGPGSALAWAWENFVLSAAPSGIGRTVALVVGRVTAFWLKYADLFLANRPHALRCASCYYFLGRKPLALESATDGRIAPAAS